MLKQDDQLGALSGSLYPIRTIDRVKRDIDLEPRSNRDRYQPYNRDRRNSGSGRNSMRNERRSDRGQSNRVLLSKNSFYRPVRPKEVPRLSENNFNVNVANIVSAIGHIKDTKWPRPLQPDPSQRDPNLMWKYHGIHCHRTKHCRQLREEVARLFNNRHLREFLSDRAKNHFRNKDSNKQTEQEEPQHVINMIISGVDDERNLIFQRRRRWEDRADPQRRTGNIGTPK